jgi:hypothetical protein
LHAGRHSHGGDEVLQSLALEYFRKIRDSGQVTGLSQQATGVTIQLQSWGHGYGRFAAI